MFRVRRGWGIAYAKLVIGQHLLQRAKKGRGVCHRPEVHVQLVQLEDIVSLISGIWCREVPLSRTVWIWSRRCRISTHATRVDNYGKECWMSVRVSDLDIVKSLSICQFAPISAIDTQSDSQPANASCSAVPALLAISIRARRWAALWNK